MPRWRFFARSRTAFQKAVGETLADEVKSGQITQAQADAIKQKLANQTPCTLPSAAGRTGDKGAIGAYLQQYMSAAASALGITQAQLTTDLKNGQSLSQIAAAQKVSEADFRTRLIANLMPALDKAVADKKLTAAQEQAIVNRLLSSPDWRPLYYVVPDLLDYLRSLTFREGAERERDWKAIREASVLVLDDYGAENPAEFFAVATEAFFERPVELRAKHPALYEELRAFYQQDPATWSAR